MHLKPQMPSSLLTKLMRTEKDHERNYKGGTRGGKDTFNWENIKDVTYKNRESYLGHTTKIGCLNKAGKWERNDWYKSVDRPHGKLDNEKRKEIKRKEEELMDIKLGLKKAVGDDLEIKRISGKQIEVFNKKIKKTELDSNYETVGLGFKSEAKSIQGKGKYDFSKNNFVLEEKTI